MAMKTFLVVVFFTAIALAAAGGVLGYVTSTDGYLTLFSIGAVIALLAFMAMCFADAILDLLKEDNR